MKIKHRIGAFVAGSALAFGVMSLTPAAKADTPTGNKIACSGECTLLSPNRALIQNSPNGGGAVYIPNQPARQLIGDISKLSFNYSGTGAVAGAPRFSIAIATDGTGDTTAFFAFADIVTCNNGSIEKGQLDVVNDPTCTIYAGSETFPNWASFVAAHPGYRIGNDEFTFIISDNPAGGPQYEVFNVQILAKSRGGK